MILCSNPKAQTVAHRREIDEAIARVLDGGRYILGAEVEAFESELAEYCGVGHAVGVGSGTEALHIALAALGIGPGDEVITTAHTAVATATAIRLCGATPVFADIDERAFTIDPSAIAAVITDKTRAIVPVHLYGHPASLAPILALGLPVVEDCAQAHGARYRGQRVGSMGIAGAFSFYPTKNLGAIGDGGAVVTNDADLARRMRLLRQYGWAERYVSSTDGWSSRLDELQAAILRVKLRHLEADNARRRALAKRYDEALADSVVAVPLVHDGAEPVYHLYVVTCGNRDALQLHLRERGIGALVHYPVPVHRQPAYASSAALPRTERAAVTVLSLPMYPELTDDEQRRVIDAILSFESEP